MQLHLTAAADDDGRRLDRILRKALEKMPLSAIHRLLRKGGIRVEGKSVPASYRVRQGQTITVSLTDPPRETERNDESPATGPPKKFAPAQNCEGPALEILYEGEGLLILNKPAGLLVHGRESLDGLVQSYLKEKLPPSLSFRPGPLHRLDRPSSGLIVFSTSLEGARFFSAMMRGRKIKKQYLALVEGAIRETETWQDELVRDKAIKKTYSQQLPSGGETKTAITTVTPILRSATFTLILAEIETGRTHQIRSQAAGHGHPLLGDVKYGSFLSKLRPAPPLKLTGSKQSGGAFFLHAWRMELPTPLPRLIEAPLPEEFQKKTDELFGVDSRYIYGKV